MRQIQLSLISVILLSPTIAATEGSRLAGLSPLAVHVTSLGPSESEQIERKFAELVYEVLNKSGIPTIPAVELDAEKSSFLHIEFSVQRTPKGYIYLNRLSIKVPATSIYNDTPAHATVASGYMMSIVDTKEEVKDAMKAYVKDSLKKFVLAWRRQNPKAIAVQAESDDTPTNDDAAESGC